MIKSNISEELALECAGNYFWCSGCLTVRPNNKKSVEPHYCQDCYQLLEKERKQIADSNKNRDYWTPEGVFIHYGKKYLISQSPRPDCQEKRPDASSNASDNSLQGQGHVSKLPAKGFTTPVEKGIIMKHAGRPKKEGEVSRITRWRRQKLVSVAILER